MNPCRAMRTTMTPSNNPEEPANLRLECDLGIGHTGEPNGKTLLIADWLHDWEFPYQQKSQAWCDEAKRKLGLLHTMLGEWGQYGTFSNDPPKEEPVMRITPPL